MDIKTGSLEEYVRSILKERIQDKPFQRKEIYQIHDMISHRSEKEVSYRRDSIRSKLWELKQEGVIEELDSFGNPEEVVFIYTEEWGDKEDRKKEGSYSIGYLLSEMFKNWIADEE